MKYMLYYELYSSEATDISSTMKSQKVLVVLQVHMILYFKIF